MAYLIPFKGLVRRLGMDAPPALLAGPAREAIKLLLLAVEVDDVWYFDRYPDVALAIERGAYGSAQQHFVEHGYFEGRQPAELAVDEVWYTTYYGDVADGIDAGAIVSGKEHFNQHGYAEGRLPAGI